MLNYEAISQRMRTSHERLKNRRPATAAMIGTEDARRGYYTMPTPGQLAARGRRKWGERDFSPAG